MRRLVGVHFSNQALHQHLGAAAIELIDHGAQLSVLRLRRRDDERVGGGVGLDLTAGGGEVGAGAGTQACAHAGSDAGGSGPCQTGGSRQGRGATQVGAGRHRSGLSLHGRSQGVGQPGRVCVLQIHHVQVAAGGDGAGLVELLDQGAGLGQTRRIGRAQDQGVSPHFRNDRGFVLVVRGGRCPGGGGHGERCIARFDQALQQRGQVQGNRVLEADDLDIGGGGQVQGGDDAPQTLQVVCVVGDDQGVGAGRDVDGVVGADERSQHGHQVVGVFMLEAEDLCLDLSAAGGGWRGHHRASLQLGVRLRHDLVQAVGFHHAEGLQTQGGQELVPGHGGGYGLVGAQGQRAFDARVHHQLSAGQGGQGARHRLDVGVDEIQRDGLSGFLRDRQGGHQPQGGAHAEQGQVQAGARARGNRGQKSMAHGYPIVSCALLPWRRPRTLSKLEKAASTAGSALASPSKRQRSPIHSPRPCSWS